MTETSKLSDWADLSPAHAIGWGISIGVFAAPPRVIGQAMACAFLVGAIEFFAHRRVYLDLAESQANGARSRFMLTLIFACGVYCTNLGAIVLVSQVVKAFL